MSKDHMLVRLKPYNKRKGHLLRRLMYKGVRFDESLGWYRVPVAFAKELAELRQDHYDEDSAPAFDVMTQAEAVDMEKREAEAAEQRSQAAAPRTAAGTSIAPARDLTTDDLKTPVEGAGDEGSGDDGEGGESTEPGEADSGDESRSGTRRRRRS